MAVRIRGTALNRAPPQTATVDQWDRLMTAMLTEAVTYGRLDKQTRAQKAWFANPENDDHPDWIDRKRVAMRTWHARNEAVRRMMDLAERLSALHRALPDESRAGLSALLGHELTEYLPQSLAMAAANMGSDDVFAVASRWLMKERADDERAIGDEVGDKQHG